MFDRKEYMKEYRNKNKEEIKDQRKEYYERDVEGNREKARKFMSAAYKADPQKYIQKRSEHRVRNKDKVRVWHNAYYHRNKKVILGRMKKWRDENPDKLQAQRLRQRQKIASLGGNQYVLERKAGRPKPDRCEECGRGGKIFFDHCHKTGKFRGWLCSKCNTILGLADENPVILNTLIAYIEKHASV